VKKIENGFYGLESSLSLFFYLCRLSKPFLFFFTARTYQPTNQPIGVPRAELSKSLLLFT